MEALEKRRKIIMCSSFKGSAKSVVSGINCWQKFATTVLKYPEDKTIPPICSRDVCWFVTIFGCAGTAKNYVSAIRKACTIACCKTQHWDDEILKQALRGIPSECLRNFGGPARCKWLLTQYWIDNVLVFLLNSQRIQLALAVGIAWEFLLRLQSEGRQVHYGHEKDRCTLDAARPNGIWIESNLLWMRIHKRKNRPQGSLLSTPCKCNVAEVHVCVKCLVEKHLTLLKVGDPIFICPGQFIIIEVKNVLRQIGCTEGAEFLTWKSWRAGRATQMARDGIALGVIQTKGEWLTNSYMRYVDITKINPCKFLW